MSADDSSGAASAVSAQKSSWRAKGLEDQRPPTDRIERDRVLAAVQRRLLGSHTTTRVGRFEITERVGAGAMGVVYRGRDTELGRHVALKLLHQTVDGSTGQNGRIVREAKALAQVQHPNVVTIFDIGTHEDRTFVAMELVEGATLTEWLAEVSRPWWEVVAVMLAAGRGLEAVHREGLVHRDLKPDNILIDTRGIPRIADFGLVKPAGDENGQLAYNPDDPSHDVALTATGALMGTPAYMAPEQLQRGEADARSDQYAFGATLYEALYGERAFAASTIGELVALTAENQPPSPRPGSNVPKHVHLVVRRALRTDPEERYDDMTALLTDLEAAMPKERAGIVWRVATIGLAVALVGGAYWATTNPSVVPTAPAPQQSAPPSQHEANLEVVPKHAAVSVNGAAVTAVDGRVKLTGAAGATFIVRVTVGDQFLEDTIVMTDAGQAAPSRVVLRLPDAPTASATAEAAPTAFRPPQPAPARQPVPAGPATAAPPPTITPIEQW